MTCPPFLSQGLYLALTYKDASPERCTLFRLEVFIRKGISKAEAQKIVRKIASWLLKRVFKIFRRKVSCEGGTVDNFNPCRKK